MTDRVFFYGTLMTGFDRTARAGLAPKLRLVGRGWIQAALFDLGIYPAAVPAPDGRVWGEVCQMIPADEVLAALDNIEGYTPAEPEASLYRREVVAVTLEDGGSESAWVYFYNAPLGQAERITSGDYLQHLKMK